MKERPDVIGKSNHKDSNINEFLLPVFFPSRFVFYISTYFFQFELAMIFRVRHVGMYPISHPAQKVVAVESRNEASIVFKKFVMA